MKLHSPRLEMQLPKENTYTVLNNESINEEIHRLTNNYKIHEIDEVKCFIKQHENILNFIYDITPLINDYFPNYEKIIEFKKDPEFDDLDFLMIYVKYNNYNKDNIILEKFKDEPLYMSKFSKKINGLVCMDLC